MQTQIKKTNSVTWINIVRPEVLEIKKILLENNLNDSLAEEIVRPTATTKVDTMRGAAYLTLHFPFIKDNKIAIEEVDFLIKSNLLITSSYKEIPFLKNFGENFEAEIKKEKHGGEIFSLLVKYIYKQIKIEVEKTSEDIKLIEDNMFEEVERKIIEDLSHVTKKVFDIRSKLKNHDLVLQTFSTEANKIFGFEYDIEAKDLQITLHKLLNSLDLQKENLQEMKDTFDFLLTNKTNQIVKIFTVVSFVLLPMTFLASFFGMNTQFPSELVTSDYGTVFIMFIMFTVSTLVLLYLHFKKFI